MDATMCSGTFTERLIMISFDFQPILVASIAHGDGLIEFRTRTEQIIINSDLLAINELVRLCDGRSSAGKIAERVARKTGYATDYLVSMIDELVEAGIFIDSRDYASYTHLMGNNPMMFMRELSDAEVVTLQHERPDYTVDAARHSELLGTSQDAIRSPLVSLLEMRRSCRNFLREDSLDLTQVISLSEVAYSRDLSPVPSGGGLFPLSLFIIVMRSSQGVAAGIYQYDPMLNGIRSIESSIDRDDVTFVLNSDTQLHGASAIFVIAGDLGRHPSKYSNRGYRYTLIEAGHVAQNIHLQAVSEGLASLEYCGFNDKKLKEFLGIEYEDVWPLVCVAVGRSGGDDEYRSEDAGFRTWLEAELVGRSKSSPINWVVGLHKEHEENPPFHAMIAHFKPGVFSDARRSYKERIAIGTSVSRDLATVKALAEGYERYLSSTPYVDAVCRASDLASQWVDPREYTPFTEWQLVDQGLELFSPDAEREWVKGESADGEDVFVPSELVFYPYRGNNLSYRAHSSGCAAHRTLEAAKINAIHELVERDAIAYNWLLKEVPLRIHPDMVSVHWRNRVIFWQSQGWEVDIIDLSHSGVAVVNVLARNENSRPYFVQGSSASSTSFAEAVDKAFHEMEVSIYALSGWRAKRIPYREVDSPADHGQLYRFADHGDELAYLFSGEYASEVPFTAGVDTLSVFQPVYVTLSSETSPLQVVRALSSELLPVNFGYGRDHISHKRVFGKVAQNEPPFPHYLA